MGKASTSSSSSIALCSCEKGTLAGEHVKEQCGEDQFRVTDAHDEEGMY